MNDENWRDQYTRAARSTKLVIALADGTAPELHPELFNPEDAVYHACSDIFHLRDWIAAEFDDKKAAERQLNKELFKKSVELAACRDIANGFKHLKLDQPTFLPGGEHSEIVGREFSVDFGDNQRTEYKYTVRVGEQRIDACQLVMVAMATWDMWFASSSSIARDLREAAKANPRQEWPWETSPWGLSHGD